MNDEHNFIKPIQKKVSSQLPAVTGSQAPPSPEYDPVKRLTDELSRMNEAYRQVAARLASLEQRQDRAEQKPQAATYEQVARLADKRPPINLNAEQFARYVQPALVASLPSAEQLQAAAQEGASAISASGTAAAGQIRQAGADAAGRIERATVASQNAVLGFLGFRSWVHAVILCFIPLLVAGAGLTAYWFEYEKRTEAEQRLTNWKNFGAWVQEKYPMVWKKYDQ
jgi:chromatin segregation and condensation protein Rec8/ScpA/Scc1 (kleisin family)